MTATGFTIFPCDRGQPRSLNRGWHDFVSQIAKREMLADVRLNVDYPAGTPKPQAPVKARGRHGSRVQRSARRRIEWRHLKEDQ